MANCSRILIWRNPWIEEPGELLAMGVARVKHNWMTNTFHLHRLCFLVPQNSVGPMEWIKRETTSHRFEEIYLQSPLLLCRVFWNSAGWWWPITYIGKWWGGKLPRNKLCVQNHPRGLQKITLSRVNRNDFQNKGHSGCLNWMAMERTLCQD